MMPGLKIVAGSLIFFAFNPLFAATVLVPDFDDSGYETPTFRLPEIFVTGSPENRIGNEQSVLTSAQVQDLQVKTAQDITGLSPNVVYQAGGTHSFNGIVGARGLMNSLYFTDPALVMYVDDVPYAASYANHLNADSVSKIDILKGPQGALFGQNGPAGVIQVTQSQPTDIWAATVKNDYGSYEHYKTFEQVSGPVSKTVDFLASVGYDQRDGYLKNVTLNTRPDGQQELDGRIAVRWKATDQLSFDLDVEHGEDHDGVQRFTSLTGPRYEIASQVDGQSDSRTGLESLKATYDAEDFRVLFISSHRSFIFNPELIDLGFGATPVLSEIDIKQQQFMQELRIQSKGDSDLQWSGGTSYERVSFKPNSLQNVAPGVNASSITHQLTDSYALFGQIDYKPTSKLLIQVGDRVQFDARSGSLSSTDPTSTHFSDHQNRQYLNTAPKIEGTYQLTDHHAVFASTGLTFRPGGYAPFAAAQTLQPYGSEKTWANSVGWRMDGLKGLYSTSVTLFWNETYNYQLERYNFPLVDVVNVPEVSSRGVEWNLDVKPADGLTLQAQVGYALATFDDYHDGVTGQSYAGNHVPYAPEETVLLGATYRHPTGWMAHVDGRGFGRTDFNQSNNPLYRQDPYALLATRIGYEAKHWSAYLYGENLTNTQYDTLIDSGLGVQVPGDPRTLGVGMELKW